MTLVAYGLKLLLLLLLLNNIYFLLYSVFIYFVIISHFKRYSCWTSTVIYIDRINTVISVTCVVITVC